MPGIRFFYQQYGDSESDLVSRIKTISDELQLNLQLIAYGKQFQANETMSIEDYRGAIQNQIKALGELIKASDLGIDQYEISEKFAQFSAHSVVVLELLNNMTRLPDMDSESENLEICIRDFGTFEDKLSHEPSRKEIMHALDQTGKLLKNINENIEVTRQNPLVQIAECYFEGAQVAMSLDNLSPGMKSP